MVTSVLAALITVGLVIQAAVGLNMDCYDPWVVRYECVSHVIQL